MIGVAHMKKKNRKSKHSNPWEPNQAEAGVVVAEETERERKRECVGCSLKAIHLQPQQASQQLTCKLTR